MVQRWARVARLKQGPVLWCAAILVACGTATGPVPVPEDDNEGGAPGDEGSLESTTTSVTLGGTGGGGSGGGGSGGGGSGGVDSGAVDVGTVSGSCNVDSRCEGANGPICDGDLAIHCQGGHQKGCADLSEDCAPGTCSDGQCLPPVPGESCSDPFAVGDGDVIAGDDFAAEFAGDIELSDHEDCLYSDIGASDAVLSVELQANDRLVVTQKGELEAVLALLPSCSSEERCIKSKKGGRGTALTYTADTDETVLVVVDAYLVEPVTPSYEILLNVNPECGNSALEALEECDDENTLEGDGCSPTCTVEFPWSCDAGSPTVCVPFPSLGTVSAGEPILPVEVGDPFGVDDPLYYTITFEERTLLDLTAKSRTQGTGDVDVLFYNDWGSLAYTFNRSGDEIWVGKPVEPGTYLVEIKAKTDLPEGFDVEMIAGSLDVCGDEVVGPFEACDNGGEAGCDDCQVVFGWVCDSVSPSSCEEVEQWSKASGEPFSDTTPVPGTTHIYWMIEFSEAVVLNGIFTSNEELIYGYLPHYSEYVALWSSTTEQVFHDFIEGDGTLLTWEVPAGRYMLEFKTNTGLPDGYTLTLETTAL